MFKNKCKDGRLNICGNNICVLRKSAKISQRHLSAQIQLIGVDIGKNAVQQIESGKRFVTDIELAAFAEYFNVSVDELLK